MKINRKPLGKFGFSHVEIFIFLIVLLAVVGVAFRVYSRNFAHAGGTYSSLKSISFGGKTFSEKACIVGVSGTSYSINAVISIPTQAGPKTSYNPLVVSKINASPAVVTTHDNWISGATSTVSFNISSTRTNQFNLGIRGYVSGVLTTVYGPSYTFASINDCSGTIPPPLVTVQFTKNYLLGGSSTNISWSAINARTCTASGAWSGAKATSGSQTLNGVAKTATYVLTCNGSGGDASGASTLVVLQSLPLSPAANSCAFNPPTSSSDLKYSMPVKATVFTGSSFPANYINYSPAGYATVQNPAGFIQANHSIMTGNSLELFGYPDTSETTAPPSPIIPRGEVGTGQMLTDSINASGGFDVCFSLGKGAWGPHTRLVILAWPDSDNFNEGEIDFFEGNGNSLTTSNDTSSLRINLHEIGADRDPTRNGWIWYWPPKLGDGLPHVVGARWNPTDGYSFYLDGQLWANTKTSNIFPGETLNYPTTPHHISMQIQDSTLDGTNTDYSNIYWVAPYNYTQ